jgi:hypothetical protein
LQSVPVTLLIIKNSQWDIWFGKVPMIFIATYWTRRLRYVEFKSETRAWDGETASVDSYSGSTPFESRLGQGLSSQFSSVPPRQIPG